MGRKIRNISIDRIKPAYLLNFDDDDQTLLHSRDVKVPNLPRSILKHVNTQVEEELRGKNNLDTVSNTVHNRNIKKPVFYNIITENPTLPISENVAVPIPQTSKSKIRCTKKVILPSTTL